MTLTFDWLTALHYFHKRHLLAMIWKLMLTCLKSGAIAILLFAVLFAGSNALLSLHLFGSGLNELAAVLGDAGTQWMIFMALAIYLAAFLFLRCRLEGGYFLRSRSTFSIYWLVYPLSLNGAIYALHYSPSASALTLFAGAVLGQGVAAWIIFEVNGIVGRPQANASQQRPLKCLTSYSHRSFQILIILVLFLSWASVWNLDSGPSYSYHSHTRWAGVWDNPNLFGLLMGTGLVLVISGIALIYQFSICTLENVEGWKSKIECWIRVFFCLAASVLLGFGLLHSFSRGSWCATGCALVYLVCRYMEYPIVMRHGRVSVLCSWFMRNRLSAVVILSSVCALCFWHFRQSDWHQARRAFSFANQEDFSWRNRVAAWEGTWQIMEAQPWFGAGWNRPEPLYEYYFLPSKLTEGAAIQMNDYLMLGATLGIPALFCFAMYLWLTLSTKTKIGKSPNLHAYWLQTTCRAGVIVLLVGFWFDGGLFKLPTAATFWILLELGAVDPQNYFTTKNAEIKEIKLTH